LRFEEWTPLSNGQVPAAFILTAAARHLCKRGHDVALIGLDEPADFARHGGIFGSHYDDGRITRILDTAPFWTAVNRAAISR
jgi:sarcosine oxidase